MWCVAFLSWPWRACAVRRRQFVSHATVPSIIPRVPFECCIDKGAHTGCRRRRGVGPAAAVPNARPRHGRVEPRARRELARAPRRENGRRPARAAAGHVHVQQARRQPWLADAHGAETSDGTRRRKILVQSATRRLSNRRRLHDRCSAALAAAATAAAGRAGGTPAPAVPRENLTYPLIRTHLGVPHLSTESLGRWAGSCARAACLLGGGGGHG